MPRVPRVAEPADSSLHDRIVASLRGPGDLPPGDDTVKEHPGTGEPMTQVGPDLQPGETGELVEPGDETAGSAEDSGGGAQAAPESPAPTVADVRAWARTNGFEVADAGPIPKDVQAAYDAADAG